MEDWRARLEQYVHESCLPVRVADIRAALERDDEVKRLIGLAGDWIETDPSLRSTACIEVALDHAKELDVEVAALRQRVEELEQSEKAASDCYAAAEAENVALRDKLARVVSVGHNNDCIFCGLKDKIAAAKGE